MSDDPRFARLHTDPRFVRPKASKNKIVVDKRFQSIFQDDEVKGRKVDKYGRKLEKESTANELKRYYRMEDEEAGTTNKQNTSSEESGENDDEQEPESEDEEEEKKGVTSKSFVDLARGEVLMESSDEEDGKKDDEDEEDDDESESEAGSSADEGSVTFGGLTKTGLRRRAVSRSPSIDLSETEHPSTFPASDEEAELDEDEDEEEGADPTKRIAVVNMDWDNLRAVDLYRVLASALSSTASSSSTNTVTSNSKAQVGAAKKFDERGEEVQGFKPSSKLTMAPGRLLNLRIYPSQFGRERMEKEAREGPPTEVFAAAAAAESDEDEDESGDLLVLGRRKNGFSSKAGPSRNQREDEEHSELDSEGEAITEQDIVREQVEETGEDYDNDALRKYQLERLRYYYAVATFDSANSAAHVYGQINGTEFERTANIFDLQYVPDETSFDDDPVHDEATESSVAAEGASYTGIEFVTDALRHSKVKLTWDADDPHRKTKIQSYLAAASDPKGKGKGLANDEDLRAYLASDSDEEQQQEEEEVDDFFEAQQSKKQAGTGGKRDKLRSLFGLDGELEEQTWDGGKKAGKKTGAEGEMQITFAPALSTKKSQNGPASDDEGDGSKAEETAIETYKRKEKERRERKRLERKAKRDGVRLPAEGEEGPEFGGEDVGPGGFDDDFFADNGKDPFAAYDEGAAMSGDEIGLPKKGKGRSTAEAHGGKMSKRERREAKEQEEAEAKQAQASLELLVASDDDNDGARHFDMRTIIKAEKNSGKKNRHLKKKGKAAAIAEAEGAQLKDTFEIDLKDDRFKSLHEDYDFAIDPTNPKYQKTRNMQALLSEGRERRSKTRDVRAPVGAPPSAAAKKAKTQASESDSLQRLVESVKRKAGDAGGRGKRTKTGGDDA